MWLRTVTIALPAQPISFDGDAWLGYVPIRMPDTICVQERLPARRGSGADQPEPHLHRHLSADRRPAEKLFDAIDGERTIGEIVVEHGQRDTARALFERFWRYDQVVFDTSR